MLLHQAWVRGTDDPLAGFAVEAVGRQSILAGKLVIRFLLPLFQCRTHLNKHRLF